MGKTWGNSGCVKFVYVGDFQYSWKLPNTYNHAAEHIDAIGFGILKELSKMGEGDQKVKTCSYIR